MSTQSDELVFIVDETHEDKKCERGAFDCPKQAVWNVEWNGCCDQKQRLCLACFDILHYALEGHAWPDGNAKAKCAQHGRLQVAKRVSPVERT